MCVLRYGLKAARRAPQFSKRSFPQENQGFGTSSPVLRNGGFFVVLLHFLCMQDNVNSSFTSHTLKRMIESDRIRVGVCGEITETC